MVKTQLAQFHQVQKTQSSSLPWCWILIDALFSHEDNWVISIKNSEPWSQDHNHRPKFHLPWWHFLKSWNLKRHDRATPIKLTKAVAFVRPSKPVEQISRSLASCSNLLLKHFERNHKSCSDPQKFRRDKDWQNVQIVGGRWQCEILMLHATRRNYW